MDYQEIQATLSTQDTTRRQTKQKKHNTICVGHHYTQDVDKQNKKHNTICVGHHYTQANTNNVNKTSALLQITGGKDEPNIR